MGKVFTASRLRRSTSGVALALAALSTSPATAQDVPEAAEVEAPAPEVLQSGSSEEIIVTARRRSETLLDVPVAVTALGMADLQRYAANDLSKIGQMVPQVQIVRSGAGTGGSFTIRGVGSSAGDAGIEQTVSVNIDGIQISRGRAVLQSFFDVEQVEVLKGPQALFFGKNSPGGVISVRTAGPSSTFKGYARGGYEFNADEAYFEAAIGGPISDTLGFRVAGRASTMKGWMVNTAPARANPLEPNFPLQAGNHRQPGGDAFAGRLTLVWEPTDSFDLTGKLFGNYSKENAESLAEVLCRDPNGYPTTSGIEDIYGDCRLDGRRSSTNAPTNPEYIGPYPGAPKDGKHYAKFRGIYGSVTANYRSGPITFTSVTGFYDYKVNTWDNFDYTSIGLVQSVNDDAYRSVSQEFRVYSDFDSPLNFVVGAFYENARRNQETNGRIAPLGPDPRNGKYETWDRPAKNWGDTYSGYGQLIYKFGDAVELAGGVRWTHEKKRIDMRHTHLHAGISFPGGPFLAEGIVVAGDFSDTNWSPEATLTWHPTARTTLYAAYKTGYKSGGFSNPSALSANYANIDEARFGSETAEGGEIGFKGSFANGRISLNAAVYRYTFDGLQLSSFNSATTTFTIRNAARARTTGFEVETNVHVTDNFTVRNAVGYNSARYLDFTTASCYAQQTVGCNGGVQDLTGKPLVRAPDWSLTTGFSYDVPLGDDLSFGISGDAKFSDSYYTQENLNPLAWQDEFWLFNASARVRHPDDTWELALIGRNLTDQRYGISSADKPLGSRGEVSQQPGRSREVVIQGTIRF